MRRIYYLVILPALFVTIQLAGQTAEHNFLNNQYAPTPKALEMIRYGHLSPNLAGGMMEYELPIYAIEDKDFSIPVILRYSSGGFRPNQQTGEAGLGWSLIAGGAITREIVGLDDFQSCGITKTWANISESSLYSLDGTIDYYGGSPSFPYIFNEIESTSDIYHFSMPGHSGNFVYHHTSRKFLAYGTDHGAGSYDITFDSGGKYFIIKTGDGYTYQFGDNTSSTPVERSYTRLPYDSGEAASGLLDGENPIVSWLLTSITAPNGRTISFDYSGNVLTQTLPSNSEGFMSDVVTTFTTRHTGRDSTEYYKMACLTSTKYLNSIIVDSGKSTAKTVTFTWQRRNTSEVHNTTDEKYRRLVVPTKKLSSITVECGTKTIRQASLTYTDWGVRPLLSSVNLSGEGNYTFQYYTNGITPPDITTNSIDFWGFYNGVNTPEDSDSPMAVDEYDDECINNTYRNPNWNYAVLGMLTHITYPTGGNTNIQYEANRASKIVLRRWNNLYSLGGLIPSNPNSSMDSLKFLPLLYEYSVLFGNSSECGGVRVNTITDNDLSGPTNTRTFQYTSNDGQTSSGIVQQFPRYFIGRIGVNPTYNPVIVFPGSSFDTRHVAYSRVVENNADGSQIISNYSDWLSNPDVFSDNRQYNIESRDRPDTTLSSITYDAERAFLNNILREPDSRAYQRGLLSTRIWKDANNATVQSEAYEYADYYCNSADTVYSAYIVGSGLYWWSARREICDRRPFRTTTVKYPDTGAGSYTETTTFGYDLMGSRTQTLRSVSGVGTEEERISYTGDMTSGNVYASMQACNQLQLPVEKTLLRNGKVIRSELTTYALIDSLYHPSAQYRASLGEGVTAFSYYTGNMRDSHYEAAETIYDRYNTQGNLLHSLNRIGVPTTVIYDDSGISPVAVFYGADNGEKTVYTQSTYLQQDTVSVNNASSYTYTFNTSVSGSFDVVFRGVVNLGNGGNAGNLSATLDGNSITLNSFSSGGETTYHYERALDQPLPAGFHTLVLTAEDPGMLPFDPLLQGNLNTPSWQPSEELSYPWDQILGWKMTGTLYASRTVTVLNSTAQMCTTVLFEDFELSGIPGAGVNQSRGLTSYYSKAVQAEKGKSYILGYLRRTGEEWSPEYTRVMPNSQGIVQMSVTGNDTSPIDQLVLFPEDALAETYSWSPDGLLLSRTSSGGQTEWYTYDNYGRLTSIKDTDNNLVASYEYSIGGTLSSNSITENIHTGSGLGNSRSTRTFYDGLGRPFETLQEGAWLDGTTVQGSVVSLREYDTTGRLSNSWLPVGVTGQTYTIPASIKSAAQILYSDVAPYSQVGYDNSPLDRVRIERGPGAGWQSAEKSVTYANLINTADGGDLSVCQYSLSFSGNTEAVITKGSYHPAGTLTVEETVDEDGRRKLVFTNIFDEVVLERSFLAGEGNAVISVDTYYCYDDAGRLAGVLPPMLTNYLMASSGATFTSVSTSEVAEYAYLYRYDSRSNLIAKKLPGADWLYYIYDKGDRLILSQNGNQRENNQWTYSLTDKLNRPCVIGVGLFFYNPFQTPICNQVVEVTRNYPALSALNQLYGYQVQGMTLNAGEVLSVNWYGDYSFLGNWDIPSATSLNSPTGYDSNATSQGYGARQSTPEVGRLTGAMERILGNESNNPYIWSVTYYDNLGHEVQHSCGNPMGGWDKTNTGYSYTGLPLLSRTVHYSGMNAFAERYTFAYDSWDRPLTISHAVSNLGALQTGEYTYDFTSQLHAYRYDAAGRKVLDNRNGEDALKTCYSYNLRSWLERIAAGWNAGTSSYGSTFVETLRYQMVQSPSQNPAQWGGNVSSMDWKCGNDGVARTYDFTYDGLSRLTNAVYRDSQSNNGSFNRTYTYDLHANILSLTTPSSTVTATYAGNRRAGGYTYDANGNLTADSDAGLTGMTYNALNLLSGYTESSNGYETTLTYSASGEKVSKEVSNGRIISDYKYYFGNLIYDNAMSPTRLLVDGGYVDLSSQNNSFNAEYRFYVQDHLGNNRLVTDSLGTVLQVNHYDPYGQLLTAISSTSPVSQYKYGGKEWNGTTLTYDFGARNYLPSLPRWSTMDPMAENYYSISPYSYCAGNPVNLVDPDGKDIWEIDNEGRIVSKETDTTRDAFYLVQINEDGTYSRIRTNTDGQNKEVCIEFEYGSIMSDSIVKDEISTSFKTRDASSGAELFKFFADNLPVEVGFTGTSRNNGYVLMQRNEKAINITGLAKELSSRGFTIFSITHSHPANTNPSGFERELNRSDKIAAEAFPTSHGFPIDYYVYKPKYQSLTNYDYSGIKKTVSWYSVVW